MKRRDFVTRALPGAAVATAALAGCAPKESGTAAETHPNVQWRLASSFPPSLDTLYGGCEVLAERVAALSGGRFKIHSYPAGEIVPALQVLDAAQQGTIQVGQSASYYFTGKHPAIAFDCTVPFGLSARQQTAWMLEAGGLELMRELFAQFNVLNFPSGNTGTQMGGWFRKEINSLDDLKGLKMRIPGNGGVVMSRLGVAAQVLPGGEIYQALERGAIDATEWVGPYDDEKLGFHRVAKYYYYPGWWEPGPSLSFYVNKDAWEGLPETYQEIFVSAAHDASVTMQARYDARNPEALKRLIASGVQVRAFTPDVLEAARREAFALYEEEAAKDPTYKKIYDHWNAFRKASCEWFGTAERSYADFSFRGDG